MYGNLFVNTQISANLRNKLQEYTQSPDKITQKYERIHSFTKRTVRSFRKFEVRVMSKMSNEYLTKSRLSPQSEMIGAYRDLGCDLLVFWLQVTMVR